MKNTFWLLTILIFLSCTKEKNKKWVVLDLTLMEKNSKELIDGEFKLFYASSSGLILGGTSGEVYLGHTVNSKLHKEIKVPKRSSYFKLKCYTPYNQNYALGSIGQYEKYYEELPYKIDNTKLNKINVEITPYYQYRLHINNTNCYDMTDSIFISNVEINNLIITGCHNDTLNDVPIATRDSTMMLYYKLKRNNIITYDSIFYHLDWREINILDVLY